MKTRGEKYFSNLASCAARMYDRFLNVDPIKSRMCEIAALLVSKLENASIHDVVGICVEDKLLDIGTGPGRLLAEVNLLKPEIGLYGLDISHAMIELAKKNLRDFPVNLQLGSIRHTNYESDFFSIVTCSGSFSLWDYPEESLEEIYRILKPGRSAYLFEAIRDIDKKKYQNALKDNLNGCQLD